MFGPNWKIGLDASALAATSELNISEFQPDFFIISLYKIFGYPTGIAALIICNEVAEACLTKHYFGGGSINYVTNNLVDFRRNISQKF